MGNGILVSSHSHSWGGLCLWFRSMLPSPDHQRLAKLTHAVLASPCATGDLSEVVSLLACATGKPSFEQLTAH